MYLQTVVFVSLVMRLVASWDQGFVGEEEAAEETGRSVVYMSTYNCDLSPSVCPPKNLDSYHPTSCTYDNRRQEQIDYMREDEMSDVLCLQVPAYNNAWSILLSVLFDYSFLWETPLPNKVRSSNQWKGSVLGCALEHNDCSFIRGPAMVQRPNS